MPDEYAGELPALFVTLAEGSALTGEALRAWLEPRIPERPALPKVVHVIPLMPLTPLGKVYKPALRERVTRDVVTDRLGDLAADCALSFAGGDVVVVLRGADAAALEQAAERLAAFTYTSRVRGA
jgi:fatty-acyl-CoA synthase